MRPRIFRVRLAFKVTRARLAALIALLALPVIAQEALRVSSSFPIPFAQYRHLLTTGVNPVGGGPAHTFLARLAGGVGIGLRPMQLFAPNAGNPPAGGEMPRAPLVVAGQTVLGENRTPPMAADTLWLAGPGGPRAGFSMTQRGGAVNWALYPDGVGFKFWNSAAAGDPLGLGNGVVFGMNNQGQIPYCRVVSYPQPAGCVSNCTTTCPADSPYIWGAVDAAGERLAMWDENDPASCSDPFGGTLCKCNAYHRCCGAMNTAAGTGAVATPYVCGNPVDNNTGQNHTIASPASCTGAAQKSRNNPPGCRGFIVCCRMKPN